MTEILPFKGIFYNPEKIGNIAHVVAPPFDVISKEEQQRFHESHPKNIIRLTLGMESENDTRHNNRFTRAAGTFNMWFSEGTLVQDQAPAIYLSAHEFPFENRFITRYGFVGLVGLVPFSQGTVLPHEKTFTNVKAERLELIKACHANFSAIFSMYSDKENHILNALKDTAINTSPALDFTDHNGHRHTLWRITDKGVHQYVADVMREKKIYIADGHHRYETALNYKQWLSKADAGFSADHPANHVMMYLCSMEDPGLIILPAHRMFDAVHTTERTSLIPQAAKHFDITKYPFQDNGPQKARSRFLSELKSNRNTNCVGVFMKDCPEFYLLKLKPGVMVQMFGRELEKSLIDIDVTVLERLILLEMLGFDQARLDNEKLIAYSSVAEEALDAIGNGKHDITFILNPTRIDQVRRIAEAGLIMPNKATYFYPKVITGHVMNRLT
ncbi:DUF1015 domain-containing protein [Thermodesulfobacteriota bacterium]